MTDTKVEELRKNLRKLAIEKGPGAQLPPVREMCDMFSTSRVTLREALAPLLAENILYSKEREGIFVSPRINYKSIAILFDASILAARDVSPFWNLLWVLFAQEAQRRMQFKEEICTFHNILPNSDVLHSLPDQVITTLHTQRIHGVLAVGLSTLSWEWLKSLGIPYVSFAAGGPWIVKLFVAEMVRLGARALVEQGCKRIGLWQFTTQRFPAEKIEDQEGFEGLLQALNELHMPFYPELAKIPQIPLAHLAPHKVMSIQEQGYMLAREVFGSSQAQRPDGLVIADEMLTFGALIALQQMGIRVGEDVKIATHSNLNSPMLFGHTDEMIVFEYDALELVQTMFTLLDMLMAGQVPTTRVVNIFPRRRQ